MSNTVHKSWSLRVQKQTENNIWEPRKRRLGMENNQHSDIIKDGIFAILTLDYENKMQIHGKT